MTDIQGANGRISSPYEYNNNNKYSIAQNQPNINMCRVDVRKDKDVVTVTTYSGESAERDKKSEPLKNANDYIYMPSGGKGLVSISLSLPSRFWIILGLPSLCAT